MRFSARRSRSLAGFRGVLTRPVRAVDHELGVLEHVFDLPNSASSFCMLLSIAAPAGGQAVCPIRLDSNFEMACLGAGVELC